jgi:hypothetical protein
VHDGLDTGDDEGRDAMQAAGAPDLFGDLAKTRRLRQNGLAGVAAGCPDTQVASQIELQQDLIK